MRGQRSRKPIGFRLWAVHIEELEAAHKDMMKYLSVENWDIGNEEEKEQMHLMYKLIAIVSYALFHKEFLLGSGD